MKSLPPVGSEEFQQLVDWETEKCMGGVKINGVLITGWLYFHLNHWHLRADAKDKWGNVVRIAKRPDLRDNEWIRADALEECKLQSKGYLEVGLRQGGKQLADYEPVIKEDGEFPIGDVRVGDRVFGRNGELCTVTGVFPQGVKPIYRMHLIDGRYIDSGEDHLWEVYDSDNQKYIKTTRQLLDSQLSFKHKRSGYSYKYSLPTTEEVKFSKKELLISPYILGALLGDGGTSVGTNTITTTDREVLEEFKILLPDYEIECSPYFNADGKLKDCKYTIVYRGEEKLFHNENPLNTALKSLNLKCKAPLKFIPDIYKYSSVEDRYELIRGIMDTDGSINSTGNIEIKLSSKRLIDDIEWVLRSLGIQCQQGVMDVRGKVQYLPEGRTFITNELYYRLYIKTDKPIFKLSRKLNRIKKRTRRIKTSIVKIEYLYDHLATCITVDSEDKLFLTKGFIPTHNSEFEASITGYNGLLFEHTQNVIVGGNGPDLNLLTDKLDFGLQNMWEGLYIPRIDKDWKKPMVRLGYKNKKNEDDVWSYIIIRNADGGDNTEAPAGTTSKSFVMDEIGKYLFGQVFSAAKEAFISEYGWRTIPILVGTGGSFENGADAQRYFENPDSNNFLAFTDEATGKRTCLFMSGLYRQDCKIEVSLAQWLKQENKISQGAPIDELEKIIIKVADKELAHKKIIEEREEKAKDPDKVEYLKTIMYKPLTPEECFMNNSMNIFNVEDAKRQQRILHQEGRTGTPVIMGYDGDKICHEFTDKLPISSWPLKNNEPKDAPIVIYEFPPEAPPFGLYVAGVDPYRQGKSAYSSSLGAVYIYKRMHDITSEKYQDMFVASYVARPDKKDTWEEQARLLIKYYNARVLCENDDISFIEYMKAKGDGHYLERQPAWLLEVVPNTTVKREYGIHRSSDKIRDYLHNCLKKYLETVLDVVRDKEGMEIGQIRGVTRILDSVLLDEIIKYNEEDNFDRIVAAELAIAMAYSMDPIIGRIGGEMDDRLKSYFKNSNSGMKRLFGEDDGKVFSQRNRKNKSKLFL